MKPKDLKHSPRRSNFYSYINRFLASNVGKKWDDIYSEFCQKYDINTHIGQEVRDYIENIAERPIMKDGKPYTLYGPPIQSYGSRNDFYICPETGTLKLAPTYVRPKRTNERDWLVHREGKQYFVRDKDVWYLCDFAYCGDEPDLELEIRYRDYDVITKCSVSSNRAWFKSQTFHACWQRYGRGMYPVTKKQCGKKELRELHKLQEKRAA